MNDHLRLSDNDRIHALQALSTHFTEGRLNEAEFNERTGAVTAARTIGDLRPLFADLPDGLPFRGGRPLSPVPAEINDDLRELRELKHRGKKVEGLSGLILGLTLLSFLILQFAVGVSWAWMVWPSLIVTLSVPRLIYHYSDDDEKIYEELKKTEAEQRQTRVERAAERMRELEEGN